MFMAMSALWDKVVTFLITVYRLWKQAVAANTPYMMHALNSPSTNSVEVIT